MELYALAVIIVLAVAAVALGVTVFVLSVNNNDNNDNAPVVYNVTFENTVGEIITITLNDENGEINVFELGATTSQTVAIPRNSSVTFSSSIDGAIDLDSSFDKDNRTFILEHTKFIVEGTYFAGMSTLELVQYIPP